MVADDAVRNDRVTIEVDAEICPLLSLQKAAYEFSNRVAVSIDAAGNTGFLVTLVSPSGEVCPLLEQFKARVADLALQEKINEQTRTVREALVTAAMWESLPRKVT